MYDFIQTALTATIEAIAFIIIIGLPAHYIAMSHVREVQSWGTPATPAPHIKVQPEVKPEVKSETVEEISKLVEELVTEAIPAVDAALESFKEVAKPRSKKTRQPKLQPMSVGAATVDYATMTSEQLRKECALQGVNWRTGGDYGKPMKKAQMLTALR
jgi:hypothetical protein